MMIDKLEIIPVDKLIPYVRNPKAHSKRQIDKIVSSIREFGFLIPLVLDNENNIIAGHGRLLATQKLGLTKVPCIRVNHLTDVQIKAFRIADNKVAESEWLYELLIDEFKFLDNESFNLELTGFDLNEIEEIKYELETGLKASEIPVSKSKIYDNECPKCGYRW